MLMEDPHHPWCADTRTRDTALSVLSDYLAGLENASHEDMLKIWKALFYCMWHADKPLVQSELAGKLAGLLHAFPSTRSSLAFLKAFYSTMVREWHGVDHHRLDKYLMLVRKMFRETLVLLSSKSWSQQDVSSVVSILQDGPLNPAEAASCTSIRTHLCDVFVDELCRVGCSDESAVMQLLEPYFGCLQGSKQRAVVHRARDMFLALLAPAGEGVKVHRALISRSLIAMAKDPGTLDANRAVVYGLADEFAGEQGVRGHRPPSLASARGQDSLRAVYQELNASQPTKKRPPEDEDDTRGPTRQLPRPTEKKRATMGKRKGGRDSTHP